MSTHVIPSKREGSGIQRGGGHSRFSLLALAVATAVTLCTSFPTAVFSQEPLPVVPYPQSVEFGDASFHLESTAIDIATAASDTSGLVLPLNQLSATLDIIRRSYDVARDTSKRSIVLGLPDENRKFRRTCRDLGLWPDDRIGDEGYVLHVSDDQILIAAKTRTGVFYGVQTLKQLMRAYRVEMVIPGMTIVDWPDLAIRGLSDDISRGPVPTPDFMKQQIRRFAELKINMVMYYTEHVVKTESHGDFAPEGGSLDIDEWRRLAEFARKHHIMLMGNFQSFGHFEEILTHPAYQHLGESGRLLSPVLPESAELLRDIFSEMIPAIGSPWFSVNADETFDLGRGASKARVDSLGYGVVYAEHLLRMHEMVTGLGARTVFWGDVALQHPVVIEMLPKDMIVGTWDYSARESFDFMIEPFTEAGFDVLVVPGVLNSSRIMPDFRTSVRNIQQFVADGVRHDVLGMMNTVWDDGGSALFSRDWYGVAFGADQGWHSTPEDLNDFEVRLESGVYGTSNLGFTQAIGTLVGLADLEPTDGMNERVLWSKLIPNRGDSQTLSLVDWDRVLEISLSAADHLSDSDPIVYEHDLDYLAFTAATYGTMAGNRGHLMDAANAYRDATLLQSTSRFEARAALIETLDNLASARHALEILSADFRTMWLKENRMYALDHVLEDYNTQIDAFADAERRVQAALYDFDQGLFLPPPTEVRLAITESSGKYFREWVISGALPNPEGAEGATVDYLTDLGGELEARPRVTNEFSYSGETYRFSRYASPYHAKIDLIEVYPEDIRYVATYAGAEITSPDDRRVRATLGSNDAIEVILNGERVFEWRGKRALLLDDDETWLDLKEGKNYLLLKVSQGAGGWGFSFRLPDEKIRSRKNRYAILDD